MARAKQTKGPSISIYQEPTYVEVKAQIEESYSDRLDNYVTFFSNAMLDSGYIKGDLTSTKLKNIQSHVIAEAIKNLLDSDSGFAEYEKELEVQAAHERTAEYLGELYKHAANGLTKTKLTRELKSFGLGNDDIENYFKVIELVFADRPGYSYDSDKSKWSFAGEGSNCKDDVISAYDEIAQLNDDK